MSEAPDMSASDSPLTAALAVLVDLSRRARQARSEAELAFLLVNDTHSLVPYRQAALWRADRGLQALSGLVQPEANAPYAQWLKAMVAHLHQDLSGAMPSDARPLTASDLPAALAGEWSEWWPAHGLWLPLCGHEQPPTAGLLLARETAWSASEMALLAEWTHAWWHALLALRRGQQRPWWQPWGRDTAGALDNRRAWWRRPFLFSALALAAASFVPVRLSVLAPGELVPVNPVIVRAPLDGVVDVFHVKPNQSVKKGEPLFGFDEALIQSRLEVANQALATASTEYRQTLQQALSDPRVRPQLATLTGRIQEKRAEVSYLREQLTRARVLAPKDGVALFDDPTEWIGRPVSVGERILRIAATGDVEVEAWLPLADAIALEPGAPVQLYLNARPLEPVSASLRYMAHEAAPRPDGTFAYRVRATLDAATEHRVGLKGTAKLQGETVPAAWWVMRRPVATLRSALGL